MIFLLIPYLWFFYQRDTTFGRKKYGYKMKGYFLERMYCNFLMAFCFKVSWPALAGPTIDTSVPVRLSIAHTLTDVPIGINSINISRPLFEFIRNKPSLIQLICPEQFQFTQGIHQFFQVFIFRSCHTQLFSLSTKHFVNLVAKLKTFV